MQASEGFLREMDSSRPIRRACVRIAVSVLFC